jgi:hypothetical protein
MADSVPHSLARLSDLAREFAEAYEDPQVPLDTVMLRACQLRDEMVASLPATPAERPAAVACSVEALFGGPAVIGNWS